MVTLSEDHLDFLKALNQSQVRYLVVEGMAMVVYGVTVDGGRWTVDGGRWTVDGGR